MSEPIQEHHLEIPRTARYYTLGSPSARILEVWFVLHGYGQLAGEFIEQFRTISTPERIIVAAEGLSRFYNAESSPELRAQSQVGASWMTREDRQAEIEDYVRYLDGVAEAVAVSGARNFVLGFSQGAATASRWAALGSSRLDELILWSGTVAEDLDLKRYPRLKTMRVRCVIGERDEFVTAEKIAAMERHLRGSELAATLIRFAGGHRLDRQTLERIAEQTEERS